MEALTRLVSESLARYGLDRPVDYRRLQWSRWFRCESPHSLLLVPSKPGVFALAEEIMEFGSGKDRVGTAALGCPAEQSSAGSAAGSRRMLAVLQFGEDDDMAFVLDRMLSRDNPMRARLLSGACFVRFVVIEDEAQRRSICNALNQWNVAREDRVAAGDSPANAGGSAQSQRAELGLKSAPGSPGPTQTPLPLDPGAATNIRCPQPLPSGF